MKESVLAGEPLFADYTEEEIKRNFLRAYNLIITRAFGWAQPSDCLVPFADMANHSPEWNCSHFIVHRGHELQPESKPLNYKIKKSHLELGALGVTGGASAPAPVPKRAKFLQYLNGKAELPEDSDKLYRLVEQAETERLQSAKSVSDIELYETSDTEDNDTDEEEI
jgi:hypothetical protein